jgi:ATP-dependent Clp protease ATP-binding subunit ClpB
LEVTEEAVLALAEKGFDPQFGARPVKRVVQKEVLNALSKELLSGNIKAEQHIVLDAFDETFVFRNKQ